MCHCGTWGLERGEGPFGRGVGEFKICGTIWVATYCQSWPKLLLESKLGTIFDWRGLISYTVSKHGSLSFLLTSGHSESFGFMICRVERGWVRISRTDLRDVGCSFPVS